MKQKNDPIYDFNGLVALVTSAGIGYAATKAFAEAVGLYNVNQETLKTATANLDNTEKTHTVPEGFSPVLAQYFTGTAWLKMLVTPDENTNCNIGDVRFEAGARNNWHTHPSNQILIVTEATGYYQEEGSLIREIKVGDVVNVLPGIKHWHGASPNSRFAHYEIGLNTEKGIVTWLEPVTDEQYNSYK